MSDYINNKIIEYINENFTNITTISIFQNEIDNIINNLENTVCSIPYPYPSGYNINGINKIKSGIDFSYLIPNLFRSCYSKDSLKIPNICPTFIYINKSTHFFPLLESENIIKSFLYFNFPVNINSYNSNNNFLEDILKFKYQLYKKKYNTTYGSYTNPLDLYNEIYSSNSMLSQLLTFSNYLSESNYAVNNSVNINTFNIPWDFTYNCLCYSGFLDYTYITGNNNYDYNITNSYANLIYTINNLNYNIDNIDHYVKLVGKNNCDVCTADGGFDFSIDFNKQEELSYRIILCEILIALSIQKKGGVFIVKIFDSYTLFTIKMLYILSKSYEKVVITKPYLSRPANSEKYIVCSGFRDIDVELYTTLYRMVKDWDIYIEEYGINNIHTLLNIYLKKMSK